uniref:Uncharacterized protein n=1 Tax=Arcella intermedia TaxID=1963864 RepID=A0A6B2L8K2_9EUKA
MHSPTSTSTMSPTKHEPPSLTETLDDTQKIEPTQVPSQNPSQSETQPPITEESTSNANLIQHLLDNHPPQSITESIGPTQPLDPTQQIQNIPPENNPPVPTSDHTSLPMTDNNQALPLTDNIAPIPATDTTAPINPDNVTVNTPPAPTTVHSNVPVTTNEHQTTASPAPQPTNKDTPQENNTSTPITDTPLTTNNTTPIPTTDTTAPIPDNHIPVPSDNSTPVPPQDNTAQNMDIGESATDPPPSIEPEKSSTPNSDLQPQTQLDSSPQEHALFKEQNTDGIPQNPNEHVDETQNQIFFPHNQIEEKDNRSSIWDFGMSNLEQELFGDDWTN